MKRIIKQFVDFSRSVSDKLERAYNETYACEDYMHQICKRARAIQERNKREALEVLETLVVMNTWRDFGYLMSPDEASLVAETTFNMAKEQNLLDVMNEPMEAENGKLL
jgi:hypothetical protein